ncbi:MAG: histidine phosphotransferase family protein [Alphaproteobacteria bacterium]
MSAELRMAEMLCTKLCHDLTGPIGAVNNGAEFLSEEGFNLQSQAVELIISSAFSAVTRLQFYRNAYGSVKENGEANLADKQKMAQDFFAGSKITLDWPDSHTDSAGVSISLKMSRLICNLLIVTSSALIRGGSIAVRIGQTDEGRKQVIFTTAGPGLKWEKEVEDILCGEAASAEINPRNVQTHFTRKLADELGASVVVTIMDESFRLQVVQ